MNERIRELVRQAGLDDADFPIENWDNVPLAKFAQLIIKECITIVDEQKECLHEEQKYWHDRDYGYALAVDDASKGIKQFFGVEE
jgi:hypothetical protein